MTGARTAYVLSHPGSGRTWLVAMLGKALALHYGLTVPRCGWLLAPRMLHQHLDPRVPLVYLSHDGYPHLSTVESIYRDKSRFAGADVVLMARDPRDTLVSCYFKFARRWRIIEVPRFTGTLSQFLRHPKHGLPGIIAYLNNWSGQARVPRSFTLVRYEDLHVTTPRQLRRVLEAVGAPDVSQEHVERAVAFGSFANLSRMEQEAACGSGHYLRRLHADDPDTGRIRRGKVGGWCDYLDAADTAWACEVMKGLSPMFGYGDESETN